MGLRELLGFAGPSEAMQKPPPYDGPDFGLANIKPEGGAVYIDPAELYGVTTAYIGPSISSMYAAQAANINPNTKRLWKLRMENLEHPAGKATLAELEDLWRCRWGTTWVKRDEINDEFYNIAAVRLAEAHQLEMHELADGTRVFRLK